MTILFRENELIIGSATIPENVTFRFSDILKLGGGGVEPTWKDIILSGNGSLTLVNAKANSLTSLKLFGDTEQLPENYIDSVTLEGKCEQSGTPTPTVPVDIVCNNGTIKYGAIGKNLLDIAESNIDLGYYINNAGVRTASPFNFYCLKFISVKTGTTYTWSTSVSINYISFMEYDSTGTFLQRTLIGGTNLPAGTSGQFTTRNDTAYIRIGSNPFGETLTMEQIQTLNWQFELGTTETAYEPYTEGIYTDGIIETATDNVGNVATAEMLLAIDDNKDEQNVTSGGVIRNIGYVIFDGSETFTASTAYGNACLIQGASSSWDADRSKAVLCTHFLGMPTTTSKREDYTCFFNSTGHFYFRLEDNTVATFKQFLADQYNAGTPVIVFFVKATPATETVTGQFLSKEPVTVTGSLTGLVANVVSSSHTTPTPTQPLPINTNNGILTFGVENTYTTADGQGTFVSPSSLTTTRIYKAFGQLKAGKYKFKIMGDFEFIFQYKDAPDASYTQYGNVGTWTTEGEYEITDENMYYGVAIRNGSGSGNIYPSNFNNIGSIGYSYLDVMPVGTTETVEIYGNNMFNKNDTANIGNWYSGSNQTIAQAAANETLVMRAKPNTTYYFKHCSVKGGCRAFYTEVEDWEIGSACSTMSGNAGANANAVYSITTSANAKWIFFNYGRNNLEVSFDDQRNDFMVSTSELTSDTTYEPYFNGGTATAEMLLKVGTYQDVQEVLTGNVIRNVGVKVFDGTETFISGSNGWISEDAITNQLNANYTPYCTHFVGTNDTPQKNSNTVRVYLTSNNMPRVYFGIDKTIYTSKEVFQQYFADQYQAGTPVTIIYPLATATTETVTPQSLTIQAGTNYVDITQASIDNLGLEVSYKAGVAVTITEVQNAQLDNSVTVTIGG